MQYFFANGNEQRGPYTLEELASFGLRPDTLVWREGMEQWQRADSIAEVVERIPFAAPAPQEQQPQQTVIAEASTPAAQIPAAQRPLQSQQQQPLSYRTALASPGAQPSGLAITSLILGIVSILSLCVFHVGLFTGLPCSILAVVFGFLGKAKANRQEAGGRGMALAGLIMGFIYLGLWALLLLIIVIMGIVIAISRGMK